VSTYFSKSQIESAIRQATDVWYELDGEIDLGSGEDVDEFVELILKTLDLDHGSQVLFIDISLHSDEKAMGEAVCKFITQKFNKAGIVL
jgi:hypothetical protein